MSVEVFVKLVDAHAIEKFRIDFTLEHWLFHDLSTHGLPNFGGHYSLGLHRGLKLLNVHVLLFGDLQHALVDFVFDLLGEFEFFAFLNQQLLIDQRGNHLGPMLFDFGGRLLLGHSFLLFIYLDGVFHFTLQLRQRDHTVVHRAITSSTTTGSPSWALAPEGKRMKA